MARIKVYDINIEKSVRSFCINESFGNTFDTNDTYVLTFFTMNYRFLSMKCLFG